METLRRRRSCSRCVANTFRLERQRIDLICLRAQDFKARSEGIDKDTLETQMKYLVRPA